MKRIGSIVHLGILLVLCALALPAPAQTFTTTTVQGTVYAAGGAPVSGTLQLSWPAFTTAAGQAVAAGRTNVTIGSDGSFSVNLAPNIGAMPAGLYYTAVYHLSDGTTSTEYWAMGTVGGWRSWSDEWTGTSRTGSGRRGFWRR